MEKSTSQPLSLGAGLLWTTLVTFLVTFLGCTTLKNFSSSSHSNHALELKLAQLESQVLPGRLGVAVYDFHRNETTGIHDEERFPMQSVFKAFLATTVFRWVEEGRLDLNQKIRIREIDLSVPTGIPESINALWPKRKEYTILELVEKAVSYSDNTAADVLLHQIGGPEAVNRFLKKNEISEIHLDRYEYQLQTEIYGMNQFFPSWADDATFTLALHRVPESIRMNSITKYLSDIRDTATPRGVLLFLKKLAANQLISRDHTDQLLSLMSLNQYGRLRLMAGIPDGATIAHKTGTARSDLGICPAMNDIAIIHLKNGRKFAIASFLSGSQLNTAQNETIHADVARSVFGE